MTQTEIKESKGQEEMPETGEKLDESQQNQLEDFMDFVEGGDTEELDEAKKLEEELTDEKKEESAEEEDALQDEEETEAESEDEGSEEDDEEEEGEEEAESSDELIALKAELEETKKLIARREAAERAKEEEKKEAIKVEIDPDTLITEAEAQEFLTDPHKVLKTLAERVYVKAREDTLKDIPQLVESGARRQTALADARRAFWTENADLKEKAKSVPAVDRLIRMTANEIQADNPGWTVEQIFEETGKQVRSAISLSKKAQQIEEEVTKGKKKKPNQPSKPRGKRKSPPKGGGDERSGLQKDLDAMLSSVD